ncbi:MAG: hypothetical protein IJQ20_03365 [Paludibacteraceae bacterium]|nr:hypothetical protein [Paludibacteraceae bacterium]
MKKKSFFYLVAAVLLAMMSIGNAKAEVVKDGVHYIAELHVYHPEKLSYFWEETDYYMVTYDQKEETIIVTCPAMCISRRNYMAKMWKLSMKELSII